MKMAADERELLDCVERGEWKPAKGGKRERARYSRYAKATFRKDRRLNIRLSPEAGACRGFALSDADLQPAAQVRRGPPQKRCSGENGPTKGDSWRHTTGARRLSSSNQLSTTLI
jgi:hypothetical protein